MYALCATRVRWGRIVEEVTRDAPCTMDADKRYLSRQEVAKLFEVSPHTVYRWTREGRLPYALTPGGRRRYPRDEIQRLAARWLQVYRLDRPGAKRAG